MCSHYIIYNKKQYILKVPHRTYTCEIVGTVHINLYEMMVNNITNQLTMKWIQSTSMEAWVLFVDTIMIEGVLFLAIAKVRTAIIEINHTFC